MTHLEDSLFKEQALLKARVKKLESELASETESKLKLAKGILEITQFIERQKKVEDDLRRQIETLKHGDSFGKMFEDLLEDLGGKAGKKSTSTEWATDPVFVESLVRLCHPDRHSGKNQEIANNVSKALIPLYQKLKKRTAAPQPAPPPADPTTPTTKWADTPFKQSAWAGARDKTPKAKKEKKS